KPRGRKLGLSARSDSPASARSVPDAASKDRIRSARGVAATTGWLGGGSEESPYERPRPRQSTASRVSASRSSDRTSRPATGTRPQPEIVPSDPAFNVGEAAPDRHAAEVLALGAGGGDAPGAQHARRSHVPGEAWMEGPELLQLVHGGAVDLLLGVEARAHDPLVREVEEAPRLVEAERLGVGKQVEGGLEGHAHL